MASSANDSNAIWLAAFKKKKGRFVDKQFSKRFPGDEVADCFSSEKHEKITGFKSDPDIDKKSAENEMGMHLPAEFPVENLAEFKIKYLVQTISDSEDEELPAQKPLNAFDVMRQINEKNSRYCNLPKKKKEENNKDLLYNMILDMLDKQAIGFQVKQIDSKNSIGCRIINSLTSTLWALDFHRQKFKSRAINLPFQQFEGFNDYKAKHMKKPVLSAETLKEHMDLWSDLLISPIFSVTVLKPLYADLTVLLTGIKKYHTFLEDQQKRTIDNHDSNVHKSIKDDWILRHIEPIPVTNVQYRAVERKILKMDVHEFIDLSEYQPEDRYERRTWLKNLRLSVPAKLVQFQYNNYIGNLNFLWRVPFEGVNDDDTIKTMSAIKEKLPIFLSRAVRSDFINRYSKVTTAKPAVLRSMFQYLTNDISADYHSSDKDIEKRLTEILDNDDPDMILDLRANNGKVADEKFDVFWEELSKYLDEVTAVHERRTTETQYMPLAVSISNLRDLIQKRLPTDTPIPSLSTLRYQFWPKNPYAKSALLYTGRFKVKYAVQQRLLHVQHSDAPYCAYQWHMLKQLAVIWRSQCKFISVDDKAVVPIGQPNLPISTGVHAKCRSLDLMDSPGLRAGDHDFHVAGAIPSVLFDIEVPETVKDSFYKGTINVTLKDKVFEASSPLRHCVETINILRTNYSTVDGVNLDHPILLVYSDGGPDHRTTYISVKLAALMMFISLDLDLLVLCRTAPSQSYANPAERAMSILNLALQNVALKRADLGDFELRLRSLGSLIKLRRAAEKDERIKTKFQESISPALEVINERFSSLKYNGTPLQTHRPATESEIELLSSIVNIIDDKITDTRDVKKLEKHPKLNEFFTKHTRSRHYNFQVKKCSGSDIDTCGYCRINPPRIESDDLHFLPDPTPDDIDGKYKSFKEVYGKETDDSARPSLKDKPQPSILDKSNQKLFVAEKVRGKISCCECGKARVFYSSKRLTHQILTKVLRFEEECLYVCGSTIGDLSDSVVVREGINCHSPIETTYYSGKNVKFDDICYHCGDSEIYLGPEVTECQQSFGVVRPICVECFSNGRAIVTRNALKVGTKKSRR